MIHKFSPLIIGQSRVWIVGSSIIKDAFFTARSRPGGTSLGLQHRLNTTIFWYGKSGMRLSQLERQIDTILSFEEAPSILIIHVAANDIGLIRSGYLQLLIKRRLSWLFENFPDTLIVWSQMLPRSNWRYSENRQAMEKVRNRLNSTVSKFVITHGGCVIRYPDIKASPTFMKDDGVHLKWIGNEILLNTIQGAIETFISGRGVCYPNALS